MLIARFPKSISYAQCGSKRGRVLLKSQHSRRVAVVMPIVQMRTRGLGRWSDLLLVIARKRPSWHGNLGLSGFKDHHWGPLPLRLISKPASGVHFRKPRCPGGWREQMSFMALGGQSVRPQGSELGPCAWSMCCEFKDALVGMCTCMFKIEKGIGCWRVRSCGKAIQGGLVGTCRESSQGTPRTFCSSFLGITPLEHPSVYPPIHPFAGPLGSGPVLGPRQ